MMTMHGRMTFSLWLFLAAALLPSKASGELLIRLERNPAVATRKVRLTDIATIMATSRNAAVLAGRLEIGEIDPQSTSATISQTYLQIRLTLAGWKPNEIRIDGPDEIIVVLNEPAPLTDADVEQAALKTMQEILGVDSDELRVTLSSGVMERLPKNVRTQGGLRVEVTPPVQVKLGTVSLGVRLLDGDNVILSRPATFDVLRRHRVAIARVSMQRESKIGASDIQFENRYLPEAADEPELEDVVGRSVRTGINTGEIISLKNLVRPLPTVQATVIKRRQRVKVTAIAGALRVTLREAEALEDGKIGDFIKLRNLQSGREIVGRVTRSGHVEQLLR